MIYLIKLDLTWLDTHNLYIKLVQDSAETSRQDLVTYF